MKTIKLLFALFLAVAMTACVEDKVYEGPSSIDGVTIVPEAPTSFDDIVVTANVSGLQAITKAVLQYTINGNTKDIEMAGNGTTYTATIPAQPDKTKITYVVVVTNEAGFTTTSKEFEVTVGDKPSDYTKLVLNELFGAAETDEGKYIELYNNGDDPIKLKDVVIRRDTAVSSTSPATHGQVLPMRLSCLTATLPSWVPRAPLHVAYQVASRLRRAFSLSSWLPMALSWTSSSAVRRPTDGATSHLPTTRRLGAAVPMALASS